MKTITYVYGFGREKKLSNNPNYSSDFLYGFDYFLNNKYEVNYIIASESTSFILIFIEKVLRKLTKLPFYMSNYLSWKNIRTLLSSEVLILTNDTIALSLLPVLAIHRFIKKGKILVIVMGLLSKPKPDKLSIFLQNITIKLLLKLSFKFIFLGKKEKDLAYKKYQKYADKLKYIPFCIDSNFWKYDEIEKKYDLVFIGNDGNRDFNFLIDLTNRLSDLKFLVISNNKILKKYFNTLKPDNVDFLVGSLSESDIDDRKLKKLYNSSKISIIPLKETFQPSGQSVALQSLSVGLPVIITSTGGNWFYGEKINDEFLKVVNKNDIELWEKNIRNLLKQNNLSQNKSNDISNLIIDNLDKKRFDRILESTIFKKSSQDY